MLVIFFVPQKQKSGIYESFTESQMLFNVMAELNKFQNAEISYLQTQTETAYCFEDFEINLTG